MAKRTRALSAQTISVLSVLSEQRGAWSYGLQIAEETGLASGSLYPILLRLAERGLLETKWLEPERLGRPPRHAYRITGLGRSALNEARAKAQQLTPKEA